MKTLERRVITARRDENREGALLGAGSSSDRAVSSKWDFNQEPLIKIVAQVTAHPCGLEACGASPAQPHNQFLGLGQGWSSLGAGAGLKGVLDGISCRQ